MYDISPDHQPAGARRDCARRITALRATATSLIMRLVCTSTQPRTRRALPRSRSGGRHRPLNGWPLDFRRLRSAWRAQGRRLPARFLPDQSLYQAYYYGFPWTRTCARGVGRIGLAYARGFADEVRDWPIGPPDLEAAHTFDPTVDITWATCSGARSLRDTYSAWASPTAPASSARHACSATSAAAPTTSTATSRRPSSPAPSSRRPPGRHRRCT